MLAVGLIWGAALLQSFEFEPPFFRPWEIMIKGSPNRFIPNSQVEMDEFGDLAYRNWIHALQQPHHTIFTTDAYGFRNPNRIDHPRVVVIGDSFVVGSGLSDEETLPARLGAILGEPVYNFGAQHFHGPPLFLSDPRGWNSQIVIWAPGESSVQEVVIPEARSMPPPSPPSPPQTAGRALLGVYGAYKSFGARFEGLRTIADRDNGLGRWLKFAYHETSYRLFGLDTLIYPDGQPALVLTIDQQRLSETPKQRGLSEVVASVIKFQGILAERNSRLFVAPIPESATIYADLFPDAEQKRIVKPTFTDQLFLALDQAHVLTIDLRPAFRASKSPYLYLRDDQHWNGRATEIAARVIAERIARERNDGG